MNRLFTAIHSASSTGANDSFGEIVSARARGSVTGRQRDANLPALYVIPLYVIPNVGRSLEYGLDDCHSRDETDGVTVPSGQSVDASDCLAGLAFQFGKLIFMVC